MYTGEQIKSKMNEKVDLKRVINKLKISGNVDEVTVTGRRFQRGNCFIKTILEWLFKKKPYDSG